MIVNFKKILIKKIKIKIKIKIKFSSKEDNSY